MKTYRNDLVDDFDFWQIKQAMSDFEGYCSALKFKIEKLTVKEYQVVQGRFCYLEKNDEHGIILWWGKEYSPDAYIIPDDFNVDLKTGIVSCDQDFTVWKIIEEEEK